MNYEEYSSRNSGIIFMTAVNSKYTDKYISNTGNDSVIDNELQTLLEGCGFGLVQKTNGFREKIAGCSARTIECTAQRKGEELYLYCTVFANQSKCLISTFFCKDGEEGKYRETFDYMLENAYLKKESSSSGSSSLGSSSLGSSTSSGSTTEGVSSELKAFLDAYEDFVDEYVSFMKKYSNGSADSLSMLGDYLNMVEKLADYSSKLSEFETENMSAADYAYYLEVTLRCTEKMLEAAY